MQNNLKERIQLFLLLFTKPIHTYRALSADQTHSKWSIKNFYLVTIASFSFYWNPPPQKKNPGVSFFFLGGGHVAKKINIWSGKWWFFLRILQFSQKTSSVYFHVKLISCSTFFTKHFDWMTYGKTKICRSCKIKTCIDWNQREILSSRWQFL